MKRKRARQSIGIKLWLYFILFAAAILTALWLMQIVFLQSFYERMKTADVKAIADAILGEYGQDGFEDAVDRLTFRNAILVFLTDPQGQILYTSDEHGPGRRGSGGPGAAAPGGPDRPGAVWLRPLPADFAGFMARLSQSADGRVSYTESSGRFQGRMLIYGARLPDALLYISTPLDPVNATTEILRTQLLYVTAAALLLSLVVAFFIARRFSRPVSEISAQAAKLSKGDFDLRFGRGFCAELDALSATLGEAALELSKAEKLRRELLANISHDLRTPLTMIKAFAEMIRDISGDDRERREAHLAVIAREADRLTLLVSDIMDISVLQSGSEPLKISNFSLDNTVRSVCAQFEPLCDREGYEMRLFAEPDQYVSGDEGKLTQVLYNLIGNAINHIGTDRVIAVTLSDLGGRVRFAVEDHGEGIAETERPLIWDRYHRAASGEHRREKVGTGLGLAIVKEILESHGARYGVESHAGAGSVFWFEMAK